VTTTILNQAGALIRGPAASVFGNVGRFHLTNHGTIVGTVVNADGATDVIINSGAIHGRVVLGTGNSAFIGTGGTSGIIVAGGANNRSSSATATSRLSSGAAAIGITLGPGDDRFIFNSMSAGQIDTINHFVLGRDKLVLSEAAFAGISGSGPLNALVKVDFGLGAPRRSPRSTSSMTPRTGSSTTTPMAAAGRRLSTSQTITSPGGIHPMLTHGDFLVA
jgi:hypothetical protein